VTENPYTEHKPDDLVSAVQSVQDAIKKRQDAYAAELKRVQENDKLAREFAAVANPLVETVNRNRDSVNESKENLEAQEKHATSLLEAKLGAAELKTIQDIQAQLDQRGVTYNKHSHYVAKDVEVRLEQYHSFLQSKLKQIKENIQVNSSRGITAEQLAEIERQFETFDKNKNKVLDKNEFKACLYSLGEERPTAEVLKTMSEFGDGKTIPYEGFKKFMIKLFGDANTKDEIANGFKLLAHDNEHVTEAQLASVFQNLDDVAYLKQQAPAAGDALNYGAWTEAVFSR
jgi:actinin alpha